MPIFSMTGFGKAEGAINNKDIRIEIRSLNSKILDVKLKLPNTYRDKEFHIRKLLSKELYRGKIDLLVDIKSLSGSEDYNFNDALFKYYYQKLKSIALELGSEDEDLMQTVMRVPNIIAPSNDLVDDGEWTFVYGLIKKAVGSLTEFRAEEGGSVAIDLSNRIARIKSQVEAVEGLEEGRIEKIKKRLKQNLNQYLGGENIDRNRFEQEVIYYLEKLDINEEKVRLLQHCEYFISQIEDEQMSRGRKLNFISQEIGREINTMGAKAYSASVQKHVIIMKEELDKIKEQILNIL